VSDRIDTVTPQRQQDEPEIIFGEPGSTAMVCAMSTSEDRLREWRLEMGADTVLMADLLPDDIDLDHSVESLHRLGRFVVEEFDSGDDNSTMLLDGIAGYLGESLLRVTGGSWGWDDATDRPLVRPDERLGLDPVSPKDLFDAVLEDETPDGFAQVWSAWVDAARRYRREHPSWIPTT
jgi:hypothetical protein